MRDITLHHELRPLVGAVITAKPKPKTYPVYYQLRPLVGAMIT